MPKRTNRYGTENNILLHSKRVLNNCDVVQRDQQQSILFPREVYCCTEQATCCIETEVCIYMYIYILVAQRLRYIYVYIPVAQRLVRPKLAWTLVNPENGMEGAS